MTPSRRRRHLLTGLAAPLAIALLAAVAPLAAAADGPEGDAQHSATQHSNNDVNDGSARGDHHDHEADPGDGADAGGGSRPSSVEAVVAALPPRAATIATAAVHRVATTVAPTGIHVGLNALVDVARPQTAPAHAVTRATGVLPADAGSTVPAVVTTPANAVPMVPVDPAPGLAGTSILTHLPMNWFSVIAVVDALLALALLRRQRQGQHRQGGR